MSSVMTIPLIPRIATYGLSRRLCGGRGSHYRKLKKPCCHSERKR